MKVFEGDLVLKEDTVFDVGIEVKGSIFCSGSLIVKGNIKALDINAGNIDAGNINAGNIDAEDIKAWDINAGNINAWNINAWDIKAWDIKAGDISYFAVCFAYKNINCKSIEGRRKNSKHFVLDGKLIKKRFGK